MWKFLFYFTRREKSGLIFLIILIAGIFAGKFYLLKPENQLPKEVRIESTKIIENDQTELIANVEKHPNNNYSYNQDKKQTGKYKQDNEKRTYFNNQSKDSFKTNDSIRNATKINKLEVGSKINLNTADTTLMMRVPGIGQSYAVRILKYRKILGGFYSVEQLKEVYGMYEELYEKIIPYFAISKDHITLISINKVSLDQLRSHPYLDFYQAKAIVELRKKSGKITNYETLSMLDEFSPEVIEKIKNYFSFE